MFSWKSKKKKDDTREPRDLKAVGPRLSKEPIAPITNHAAVPAIPADNSSQKDQAALPDKHLILAPNAKPIQVEEEEPESRGIFQRLIDQTHVVPLQASLSKVSDQLAELGSTIHSLQTNVVDATKHISALDDPLHKLQTPLDTTNTRISELGNTLATLQNSLNTVSANIADAGEKLGSIHAPLEALHQPLEEMKSSLHGVDDMMCSLERTVRLLLYAMVILIIVVPVAVTAGAYTILHRIL